ncbi:MoaD/ThiS family protein [Nocardia australiensis]|uniref:MoaD/ThiS family protein n=1 Tax=Nocardia australiensis TaxID=2887191 RepID=UPI001D144B27|nr:MoaD/ThiS family protein [Nocardia australiensis]
MIFDFHGILLRSANNQRSISIAASTLDTALDELTRQFPDLKRILLDNSGRLRRAHRVCLNGQVLAQPDNAMSLSEDDRVEFLTAIAGG